MVATIAITLFAATMFAACGDDDTTEADAGATGEAERLQVVATTVQIKAIVDAVGQSDVEVRGIVPAGADAHDFEPVASDLAAIDEADLILRHGIGLDEWLDDTLESGGDAKIVTVTDGIELKEGAVEEHEGEETEGGSEEEHADEGLDPHVWHDPANVKIMASNIADALAEADPAHADSYNSRAAAYSVKLDETAEDVRSIIAEIPPENRKLVTNHDAFGYFARAFGLEIVGAVIPNITTSAEPSAQDTADLLNTIEREHVKAIFAESSVNPQLATTLADDAGVAIVDDLYGDSLGEPGSGADTIEGMLLTNAHKIADALK
jgi:zinc/manganese transport system substrate-binding protein